MKTDRQWFIETWQDGTNVFPFLFVEGQDYNHIADGITSIMTLIIGKFLFNALCLYTNIHTLNLVLDRGKVVDTGNSSSWCQLFVKS